MTRAMLLACIGAQFNTAGSMTAPAQQAAQSLHVDAET